MRQPSHTSRTGRKRRPLGADEIQVRVSISPVHRGDLVAAETDLPDGSAGRRLGTEAAGVVTAVGPSVPALRVGDRVAVFRPRAHGPSTSPCRPRPPQPSRTPSATKRRASCSSTPSPLVTCSVRSMS
ncbi:alcohol dehydrogenase catalytic domain-containing protein [Streptomyces sp. NPDC014684]|uniref:alcohol dehydrogenase catalytic domain-containing protein n=1 Tax=Streptomyces sp. NPDC014684 TaxID=3364880 RepID=UPI0036F72849